MQQDCISTAGETMYGCASTSLYSSKNHVSLADLADGRAWKVDGRAQALVGPGLAMSHNKAAVY